MDTNKKLEVVREKIKSIGFYQSLSQNGDRWGRIVAEMQEEGRNKAVQEMVDELFVPTIKLLTDKDVLGNLNKKEIGELFTESDKLRIGYLTWFFNQMTVAPNGNAIAQEYMKEHGEKFIPALEALSRTVSEGIAHEETRNTAIKVLKAILEKFRNPSQL